jgi:hypothetical protein
MHGVFRSTVDKGLMVRGLSEACETNRKVRKAGEGLEMVAFGASLAEAMEARREIVRAAVPGAAEGTEPTKTREEQA